MFTLIKRLLGLDTGRKPVAGRADTRGRQMSATAHLFRKDAPAMRRAAIPADQPGKPPARQTKPRNDFDPYNTGKFDRGASWERISKSQR